MTDYELNILAAEKVMGNLALVGSFFPAQSISDAFMLVDKMIADGFVYSVQSGIGPDGVPECWSFTKPGTPTCGASIRSPRTSAITIAALRAKGVAA